MALEREIQSSKKGMNRREFFKGSVAVCLSALCSSCTFPSVSCKSSDPRLDIKSKFGIKGAPRKRWGRYASATAGTNWLGQDIGRHNYNSGAGEKIGIIYTPRGGFIDMAHLRKPVDWTAYLAEKIYPVLVNNGNELSFTVYEPSKYFVKVNYPENWKSLSFETKDTIAEDISIGLGEYLSYTLVTWHEILTWYGYRCTGLVREFPSAFSWEENYSNLLGAIVGGKALRRMTEKGGDFSSNATIVLDEELKKLGGILDKHDARKISASKSGEWYSGALVFVNMKRRDFDIGEDGYVTPVLVPNEYCPDATPLLYAVPNLNFLDKHGFSVKVEIKPRNQTGDFKRILGTGIIEPDKHFPLIVEDMKKQADKKGYIY